MSKKTLTVYTLHYRPFIMGGNVWQPISCEVEGDGPHELGGGYSGYIIIAPNGKQFIAEAESGAFIGPSLEAVRKDISEAITKESEERMAKQVVDAKIEAKKATKMKPAEFWKLFKN